MENASKALLMAAEVLIGVLILSLAVYLYVSFGTTAAEVNEQNTQKQLVQFNTQFTVYQDRNDLTIYDIITATNLAKESNDDYYGTNSYADSYQIIIRLGAKDMALLTQDELDKYLQSEAGKTFRVTNITYHASTGRVWQVIFQAN